MDEKIRERVLVELSKGRENYEKEIRSRFELLKALGLGLPAVAADDVEPTIGTALAGFDSGIAFAVEMLTRLGSEFQNVEGELVGKLLH